MGASPAVAGINLRSPRKFVMSPTVIHFYSTRAEYSSMSVREEPRAQEQS
jgi:hypothetical protein